MSDVIESSSDLLQALQHILAANDKEWVSESYEATIQIAPYTPLKATRAGGVTVNYSPDETFEQRVEKFDLARTNLRNRLIKEVYDDLRVMADEYRKLMSELSENQAFGGDGFAQNDPAEFQRRAYESGRAAPALKSPSSTPAQRRTTSASGSAATKKNASSGPVANKLDRSKRSEPVDFGAVCWPVKSDDLNSGDLFLVACDQYTFDTDVFALYGPQSDKPKARMYYRLNDQGEPNYFWKKVWGDWIPSAAGERNKGDLPDGMTGIVITGGEANQYGKVFQNVVAAVMWLEEMDENSLPKPDQVKLVPVGEGLCTKLLGADDTNPDEPF